ncbi:hypothetical protein [Pedobacter aquatilis]|uniref:hypothetical protein n=1 Tax=Pedobacter aquatilis TaxID=351343 RepID=UPI002930768A|nr:hypothetical protein [Pedobacter aquatilis]
MQPMQDKDFDQLFKNAFEDVEIAPSRDLWGGIESEIEPKKKRIFPVYWLSAAAILVIATVGVLIYQQQDVKPKQFANNMSTKEVKPLEKAQPAVIDSIKTPIVPNEKAEQASPVISKPIEVIAKTTVKEDVKAVEKQKIVTAPEMQKQETTLAMVEPEKDIKEKIADAVSKTNTETVYASATSTIKTDDVTEDNSQAENKGIRNVGDVVNLIVNKVDKRKDKLIQFRTDDDDSSIASINIGPFRFGKKKK